MEQCKQQEFWGSQAGAPVPPGPVPTCVNWVEESLFSEPQFLGLENGTELHLPHRIAQTISLDNVCRVTSTGQAHSIAQ